jgi:hypothetical protein
LISFAASAFNPASSAGHEAAGAAVAAETGAAGALACANSGAAIMFGTSKAAAKNDLQMRVVFMRKLYQIQSRAESQSDLRSIQLKDCVNAAKIISQSISSRG